MIKFYVKVDVSGAQVLCKTGENRRELFRLAWEAIKANRGTPIMICLGTVTSARVCHAKVNFNQRPENYSQVAAKCTEKLTSQYQLYPEVIPIPA